MASKKSKKNQKWQEKKLDKTLGFGYNYGVDGNGAGDGKRNERREDMSCMGSFEEALVKDVLSRFGRLDPERRMAARHTAQAANCDVSDARNYLERQVDRCIGAIRDEVLFAMTESLASYFVQKSLLVEVKDKFDATPIEAITQAVIDDLVDE